MAGIDEKGSYLTATYIKNLLMILMIIWIIVHRIIKRKLYGILSGDIQPYTIIH